MSCEFTPHHAAPLCPHGPHCITCPGNGGTPQRTAQPWLTAAEVEAMEHAESVAAERWIVSVVLAALATAGAVGFAAGYLFTRWGWN